MEIASVLTHPKCFKLVITMVAALLSDFFLIYNFFIIKLKIKKPFKKHKLQLFSNTFFLNILLGESSEICKVQSPIPRLHALCCQLLASTSQQPFWALEQMS